MIFKDFTKSRVVRQYLAGLSCCLTMSMISSGLNWSGPAISKLQDVNSEVHLNHNEITWMVATIFLGNLISPIPAGYLMDKFGRKTTLLYATLFSIVSWVILYFAVLPYHFYIARFLSGLTNGVAYTITPIYIAEISEPNNRGTIGNMLNILANSSSVYIYAMGMYVGYKGLVIAASVIPVLFFITFIWIPESPYFYVMKSNNMEAIKSLIWFRYDKPDDEIVNELDVIERYLKEQMKCKGRMIDLIKNEGYRKGLIIAQFLVVLQRVTGIGALMSYSSVTIPKDSLTFLTTDQCATLLAVAWFVTPIITLIFIDSFQRRTLLMVSASGCALMNLIAGSWFYMSENLPQYYNIVHNYNWIPYAAFLIHAEMHAVAIGPIGTSMRGELHPANIKAKASAISAISVAFISFFIGKFFLTIADNYGMHVNFFIFGFSCALATIFIYVYILETKGKSLEQIQDELNAVNVIVNKKIKV